MGLLTKWSVRDIQASIAESAGDGRALMAPNISWGFFKKKGMEADLLWLHGTKLEEFEIKRSKEDFLADFKKPVFHDDVRIVRLTYVLPEALAGDWLKSFCQERYKEFKRVFEFRFYREYDCSLILPCSHNKYKVDDKFTTGWYFTDEMVGYINAHDPSRDYYRGLFAEEMSELFRLVVIRYWSHERADFVKRRDEQLEPHPVNGKIRMPWYDKERIDKLNKDGTPITAETVDPEDTIGWMGN